MLELIVSDMDGTLINGSLEIPQKNIEAIRHTYSLGIPFVVCTGRNFIEAKKILDHAGIRCPILGLNGAIRFDREGNVEYEIALSNENALKIIEEGEASGLYMEAMTSKNVYSSSRSERIQMMATLISNMSDNISKEEALVRASQSNEVTTIEYRKDLRDLIYKEHQQILKITFSSEEGQDVLRPFADKLLANLRGIYATSSFKYNMEFSNERGTKGDAVLDYCHEHGYNIDNVMCVGDNFNDIPMLQEAGISFAMENAEDEVKEAAKYVTGSNNNGGVADAIYRALELTHTKTDYK